MLDLFSFRSYLNRPNSILHSNYRYQFLATLIVNIITFSHGVGVGWLSPTLIKIQSSDNPLDFSVTIDELSWLGSMLGLGSFCGNVLTGLLLDRGGRKLCIYMIALPYACLWVLVYSAKNVIYLYMARFFCGYTGGASYVVIPIYLSEIADTNVRGSLSSIMMLSVDVGVLVGFILSTYLPYHVIPLIIISLPVLYFVANLFFPETAHHLIRKRKYIAAERSYKFYKNINESSKEEERNTYQQQFDNLRLIISTKQDENNSQLSLKDFTTKPALKAFGLAIVLMFGYQFSGIFSFMNYMSDIFAASNSALDPNTCTILMGVAQILGVYATTLLVDIYGRKLLMLISTGGMGVGLVIFGCCTYYSNRYDLSLFNWLPVVLMAIVIFLGNLGLIGLFFIILVEVFPAKIRSVSTSIMTSALSLLVFVVLKIFPLMLFYWGISATMWFSATACLLTFAYFYLFLPETKDKSMIED